MIGRWPTLLLLLLLSVCNTIYIYSHFFSSHKVLFCFCVCSLQFFFRVFDGILASHFAPLTFYTNSFYQSAGLLTRDVCSRPKLFSWVVFAARVPPLSLSNSFLGERERERERERSQHSLSSLSLSKSPHHQSIERLFFRFCLRWKKTPTPAVFCTKKRKSSNHYWTRARKFSRIKNKHARVSRRTTTTKAQSRERES